jgi:hypothetical protein
MNHQLNDIQDETTQKSLLDGIANLVGVILILFLLVSATPTADVPVQPEPPKPVAVAAPALEANLEAELESAQKEALAARAAVEKMATRLVRMREEAAGYENERVALAMHRSVIEEDISRRREALDAEKQQEFDVQTRIASAQLELDQLTQEQMGLLTGPETVEELESVPTPLAREVDGDSIHLRLKNGLVSVVPLNELLAEVQSHAADIGRRLQSSNEVVETFGPIDGYRVRMTVMRVDDPGSMYGPRAGEMRRSTFDQYAEVLPTSESIGQDAETALMPGGTLYQYLQEHRRQCPTVVIWLYTDSFDHFRLLKRTLWEMGFSMATRPLMPGSHIGASPHGTKAAAQ